MVVTPQIRCLSWQRRPSETFGGLGGDTVRRSHCRLSHDLVPALALTAMLAVPTIAAAGPLQGPFATVARSPHSTLSLVETRSGSAEELGLTVAVELEVDDETIDAEALRGWLVRRLLEEGYAVASTRSGAHGVVRVRSMGDGLVVEVEGDGRRSHAIEDGPAGVVRLEVLHRAVQGVEQVCHGERPIAAPEAALALRILGDVPDDPLLEALAAVIDKAGMTLRAAPLPEDTLVCLERRGSLLEVGIGPGADDCRAPWLVLDLGDGSPAALRHAGLALVEALHTGREQETSLDLDALTVTPPRAAPAVVEPEASDDDELAPMEGPPRSEMRLGLGAGIAVRGSAVDPLIRAGWRMGRLQGFGGRLFLSVIPSSGLGINVADVRLAVGPDWSLSSGGVAHLDIGLLLGTDLHTFGAGSDERTAGDLALGAGLPITFGITLRRQTRIDLCLDPGITARTWEHRVGLARDGAVTWARPAWRVGLTLGITYGWRIE